MCILKLLLIGFLLLSLEVSGRRRRCCCCYQQERRTKAILDTPRLSLFKEDYKSSSGAHNRDMCGYLDSRIMPNGTFPREYVGEFAEYYMAFIYNEVNFPLTYRSKGVYLRPSSETVGRYWWHYCVPFHVKFTRFFIYAIIFSIIFVVFIGVPVCIIGLLESMLRRLRRGRMF
jgi:hypothetical protein